MQTRIKYGATKVARDEPTEVHVLLELEAPAAPEIDRPPIDVVAVIDRSGSMAGPPLQSVKEAVARLIRFATPKDRIGVVVFDDTSSVILPLERHVDVEGAVRRIMHVESRGSTNLSGGWLQAREMLLQGGRAEALRRIIVLTDGHANVGLQSIEQFAPVVSDARSAGVTTTTIGFADGYDEQFLAGVADAGGGNEYWCAGSDQATRVFTTEFDGLASVVVQNIEATASIDAAASRVDLCQELPHTRPADGSVVVNIGDAFGSETRRVLLCWRVEPRSQLGPVALGRVTVKWTTVSGEVASHAVELPVGVDVVETLRGVVDDGASPDVRAAVERMHAERRRERARVLADAGRFEDALDFLLVARADFERLGLTDEVALLNANIASVRGGRWSSVDSKKAYSRYRGSSKGRRVDYDDER